MLRKRIMAFFLSALMVLSPIAAPAQGVFAEEPIESAIEQSEARQEWLQQWGRDNEPLLDDAELFSLTAAADTDQFSAAAAAGEPGLDLLLSAYNVLGGQAFIRRNMRPLFNDANLASLSALLDAEEDTTFFTGGNQTSYNFQSARSFEHFSGMRSIDLEFDLKSKVDVNTIFYGSYGAYFNYNSKYHSDYNYSNSYENNFTLMEIRRNLGVNLLRDSFDIQRHKQAIWDSLYPGVKEALLGYSTTIRPGYIT